LCDTVHGLSFVTLNSSRHRQGCFFHPILYLSYFTRQIFSVITFLLAPDKFKGSLSSFEVCNAIEEGLLQACPLFRVVKLPMADGGDGLAEVIRFYTGAVPQSVPVQDPLGRTVNAEWLLSADGKTAFIEMAEALVLAG
jgi:glycerate kinase